MNVIYAIAKRDGSEFFCRGGSYKKGSKVAWSTPGGAANAFRLSFNRPLKNDPEYQLVTIRTYSVEIPHEG